MNGESALLNDYRVPRRRGQYKASEDHGVMVFDETLACSHRLSGLAAEVWNLCDGATVDKIVRRLQDQYQRVPRTRLREDVASVFQALENQLLIEFFPKAPRSVRVLFIEPPSPDPRRAGNSKEVSLGLSYLCRVSEDLGFPSAILDLRTAESPWAQAEETLRRLHPEIVGITATSPGFDSARTIAYLADRVLPHSLILMGGPHVTFLARETLQSTPWVDLVVIGEAEETLAELLDYYVKGRTWDSMLAGVAYRSGDDIVITPPRPPLCRLDALPFPDPIRHTLYSPNYEELRVMGSRGCPFACKFCSVCAMSQRKLRLRHPANIVDEIQWKVRTYNVGTFIFSDNLFITDGRRERVICREMLDRSLDIQWACNCRADVGDVELFALMHQAGCRKVFVGLESGSESILRYANKSLEMQRARDTIRLMQLNGIAVEAGFILGLPGETRRTIEETIDFAHQLACDGYTFTFYCPLPGTDFYREMKAEGLRYAQGKEMFSVMRPVVESATLNRTQLIEAYLTARDGLMKRAPTTEAIGDEVIARTSSRPQVPRNPHTGPGGHGR